MTTTMMMMLATLSPASGQGSPLLSPMPPAAAGAGSPGRRLRRARGSAWHTAMQLHCSFSDTTTRSCRRAGGPRPQRSRASLVSSSSCCHNGCDCASAFLWPISTRALSLALGLALALALGLALALALELGLALALALVLPLPLALVLQRLGGARPPAGAAQVRGASTRSNHP